MALWPQWFSVQHRADTKSTEEKFYFLFEPQFLVSSSLHSSLNHSISLALFFSLWRWPWRYSSCVCSDTHDSVFLFALPSLPLFSLAGSVSLPRDSPVLCSRYRPIDFGRERKYCGHDSPCMNLMIPLLSVPSFQWGREQIKHTAFLSPSLQACQ